MRVVLSQGEKLIVDLEGSEEGVFTIDYGETALTVEADIPDTQGRSGIIYSEELELDDEDGSEAVEADEDDDSDSDEEDDADEEDE